MKRIVYYASTLLIGALSLNSCRQPDAVTPAVLQDSDLIPKGTRTFNFTLKVNAANVKGNPNARAEALKGVRIVIAQGTRKETFTTDETGIVAVNGLTEGKVTWSVEPDTTLGYIQVSGQSDLALLSNVIDYAAVTNGTNDGRFIDYFNEPNNSNQTGTVGIIVNLPVKKATIKGRVVADFDLDNKTAPTGVAGVKVRVTYNAPSSLSESASSVQIKPNYFEVLTDANGNYEFPKLPARDNLSGLSATIGFLYYSTNNGETIEYTSSFYISSYLQTDRVSDLGVTQLYPSQNNTATLTGIVFGDFSFIDKSSFYNDQGFSSLTANPTTVSGALFTSVTGVAANSFLFNRATTNTDNYVLGVQTVIGYLVQNGNKVDTLAADFTVHRDTLASFSPAGYFLRNGRILKLAVVNPDSSVTFIDAFPAFSAANYISTNVLFTVEFYSVPGTRSFVATVGADGRFTLPNLPAGTFDWKATLPVTVTLPNGYTKVIEFSASGSGTTEANKVLDVGTIELTY